MSLDNTEYRANNNDCYIFKKNVGTYTEATRHFDKALAQRRLSLWGTPHRHRPAET